MTAISDTHLHLRRHAELSGGSWESVWVPGPKTSGQHGGDAQTRSADGTHQLPWSQLRLSRVPWENSAAGEVSAAGRLREVLFVNHIHIRDGKIYFWPISLINFDFMSDIAVELLFQQLYPLASGLFFGAEVRSDDGPCGSIWRRKKHLCKFAAAILWAAGWRDPIGHQTTEILWPPFPPQEGNLSSLFSRLVLTILCWELLSLSFIYV